MKRPGSLASLLLLLLLPLLLQPTAALASDGVLEINQTCAEQTGCFSGDGPGLPVTITTAGSYRLTSNLTTGSRFVTAISVGADDVSIDLGGFTIACAFGQAVPVACLSTTSGSGSGVSALSFGSSGTSVKNGSITGMGSYGVILGEHAEVTGLRVRLNGLDGIHTTDGSTITGNTASENGVVGISTDGGSTVTGNTASNNGGDGISANFGATITGNTASENGGNGISAGVASTITGNTAYENGGDGISAGVASTVSENTAYANTSDGIDALSGATVQRNTVRLNGGYGLRLSASAAYRENVITSNAAGTVSGGLNMLSNSCNGTTVCP